MQERERVCASTVGVSVCEFMYARERESMCIDCRCVCV